MQEKTRKKLQLIVKKADLIADWGFATHLRDKGLNHRINWSADRPEGQQVEVICSLLPSQEQITASLTPVRFFTEERDNICLFRNDWIAPRSTHRIPEWLNDPVLSENWRKHYNDNQTFLNSVLAIHDPAHCAVVDGRKVIRGMIFEAYLYGDTVHDSDQAVILLDRLRNTLFGFAGFEFELSAIIMNIIVVIQRMASVTKLELAGKPVPPVPQS